MKKKTHLTSVGPSEIDAVQADACTASNMKNGGGL
jgi:hypothetical protein